MEREGSIPTSILHFKKFTRPPPHTPHTHHTRKDYYGIVGFMLAEEVSAIFGPSFMALNEDFKAFALNGFQPIPANQGSGWTAKVWGEGKE